MPLTVEILTPEAVVWRSDKVDAVSLPTTSGEIQILPGHIPLITELKAGSAVVKIGGQNLSLAIDMGYARCIANTVSVLTEAAIEVEKIDEAEAEKSRLAALAELEKIRKQPHADDDEIERLESLARFSIAQKLAKSKRRNIK